jgi:hypothetical protein
MRTTLGIGWDRACGAKLAYLRRLGLVEVGWNAAISG